MTPQIRDSPFDSETSTPMASYREISHGYRINLIKFRNTRHIARTHVIITYDFDSLWFTYLFLIHQSFRTSNFSTRGVFLSASFRFTTAALLINSITHAYINYYTMSIYDHIANTREK